MCLADALPRLPGSVPIYGSGGFCHYTPDSCAIRCRAGSTTAFDSVKIKVGRDAEADPERVALVRSIVGPDVEVMVDANGANNPHRTPSMGPALPR